MCLDAKGVRGDEGTTRQGAESLETAERPPQNVSEQRQQKIFHPLSIYVVAPLIPASIFGTLLRLGLNALATYQGNTIFPLAYAQGLGCLIMGFALGLREPLGRFYPPSYTAITTGFCGSLTTFSGWQLDVFNSWINSERYDHDGLRNFVDGLGKSVFTVSISLASLSFGLLFASAAESNLPAFPPLNDVASNIITSLSVLVYGGVFPAYFLMDASFRHQATAALLFSFPGTLTRYVLSIHLNTLLKTLPLGTLTANAIGTALLGGFDVLQAKSHPVSSSACSLLQGLSDGYCGCLTTVSTFAVEVRGLGLWRGSRYSLISWCTGQLLLLVIVGSSIWTDHSRVGRTCRFD